MHTTNTVQKRLNTQHETKHINVSTYLILFISFVSADMILYFQLLLFLHMLFSLEQESSIHF